MRKTLLVTSVATLKWPYFAMLMKYKFFVRDKLGIPYGVNIFENFNIIRRFYSSISGLELASRREKPPAGERKGSPQGPPRRGPPGGAKK